MSSPVISIEGLGKRYRIGARRERSLSLRESLAAATTGLWRGARDLVAGRPAGAGTEEFWALKDVSFEVEQGEVVGIIGRNGAGKSTLLKILSRITEPTEGRAVLRGRVGSLLEVGTGFHAELTGRENIYLSGAILGMRKAEIDRKFDEIVAFSGIEKFLDTPAKRYSSGMYVRLGFAVAAHLDPEILIIDEVLAVGDAEFQKKCLGKMGEVSKSGRTVLFVSHNMAAVESLCNRVVALRSGSIWREGDPSIIRDYLQAMTESGEGGLRNRTVKANQPGWFSEVWVEDAREQRVEAILCGDVCTICMAYDQRDHGAWPDFAFTIYDMLGTPLLYFDTAVSFVSGTAAPKGQAGTIRCRIDKLPLVEGRYTLNVLARKGTDRVDHVVSAAQFTVISGDFFGTGKLPPANYTCFLTPHSWRLSAPR
jgi:lipopolysaccharide transport system ATP-binding protein